MKKKLIATLLLSTTLLCGCNDTNHVDLSTTSTPESTIVSAESEADTTDIQTAITSTESTVVSEENSQPVDIIFGMMSLNGETAEEYVAKLQSDDPDGTYAVYDESHYTMTISESERQEYLATLNQESIMNEAFKAAFSEAPYCDVFVSMEYDDAFQHFSFYVNKDAFEENYFICKLAPSLMTSSISDRYQAYNLIPPADRVMEIEFIDNATGEIIE